jgi:tetratricopeptide (TPR) repeat protein
MKAKPDWAEPYVGRSINRVLKGSLDGAVTDLTTAIRLDRNDAQKYVSRGGIYRQQGKIPEAIADFKAALKIDPKDELARKHLEELLGAINGMQNCPSQLLNISADLLPVLKSRPGHNFIAWQWRQRKSPNRRYACLTK